MGERLNFYDNESWFSVFITFLFSSFLHSKRQMSLMLHIKNPERNHRCGKSQRKKLMKVAVNLFLIGDRRERRKFHHDKLSIRILSNIASHRHGRTRRREVLQREVFVSSISRNSNNRQWVDMKEGEWQFDKEEIILIKLRPNSLRSTFFAFTSISVKS